MKKPQIITIVAVLAVMAFVYAQPVKGLIKNDKETESKPAAAAQAQPQAALLSSEQISEKAKAAVGSAQASAVNELEQKLASASAEGDKAGLQQQIAARWDELGQPGAAAFYYKAIAEKQNTAASWITAGQHFNDAFKLTQDTTAQPTYLANAVTSFEAATKLDPENLDAKTGLGTAYVNGGAPSPMQGISLLLEVVGKDPKNVNANLNLGLFSMKSGQFEKAVGRFKTVVEQRPNEVEPYFYLAESYKQLGQKKEAIAAYEQCKKLMPDPVFAQRIDQYIKELN